MGKLHLNPRGIQTLASNFRNVDNLTYNLMNHNSTNHNRTSCSVLHNKTHDLSKIRGFKIGSLNINSLSKHIDELQVFMKDGIFDVLAINETKLDLFDPDSLIDLPGYTCIRKDRNKAGVGV